MRGGAWWCVVRSRCDSTAKLEVFTIDKVVGGGTGN
jgi:hypothetical protein